MPHQDRVFGAPCTCCERCWEKCDINFGGACSGCSACEFCGEHPEDTIYQDVDDDYYCCEQAYWCAHPEDAPEWFRPDGDEEAAYG